MNRRKLQRRTALAQVIAARWQIERTISFAAAYFGALGFPVAKPPFFARTLSPYTVQCTELTRYYPTIEGITA